MRIAIVGAESTGKTQLARTLSRHLRSAGVACRWVPESLRAWCDQQGRTPQRDEQPAIAAMQEQAIERATQDGAVVLCDTTPLMTAVYSQLLFDDASLFPAAIEWQRSCALTLLTALDLPWVADGLQRDGPHVQRPVDDLLRAMLIAHHLPFAVVHGAGEQRALQALAALATHVPALRHSPSSGIGSTGLLSRLLKVKGPGPAAAWQCPDCDQPNCEHRLLRDRQAAVDDAAAPSVTGPAGLQAGARDRP